MKKLFSLLLSSCLTFGGGAAGSVAAANTDNNLATDCKSAYLMDFSSGECLYEENATLRTPIASVCKVMTLTLVFDAVASGKIGYDTEVTVSDNAAGMGGSQVFLDSGSKHTVDELIKSIVVCSANDSCVALSETVCGSEDVFVAEMNKKAAELGCNDTLFANCTGLPRETQYSCAKDVATMFANLIHYEDYFKYSKIWLEDFQHGGDRTTSMTNTNKLLRKYSACDGGKTGFTNEAGFCLASTAKKNDLRLVSVVLGGATSDARFNGAIKLFDYGFANFTNKIVLDKDVELNDEFAVSGGKKDFFAVKPERNCYIFSKINDSPEITHKVTAYEVKAPIAENQVVGQIEVYKNGVLADTVNVVAAECVERASFGDFFRQIAENWAI